MSRRRAASLLQSRCLSSRWVSVACCVTVLVHVRVSGRVYGLVCMLVHVYVYEWESMVVHMCVHMCVHGHVCMLVHGHVSVSVCAFVGSMHVYAGLIALACDDLVHGHVYVYVHVWGRCTRSQASSPLLAMTLWCAWWTWPRDVSSVDCLATRTASLTWYMHSLPTCPTTVMWL